MLTLHHREEKATIYSEAELPEALKMAKKGFRNTKFVTEPKDNGYVIKTVNSPVQRWLSE